MKKQLTMQFYSSFKFPLIITRSYSTIDSSLVQLSEDIDFLYQNLKQTLNYSMSQNELCNLQQMLLSGFYTLSPLRLMRIRRDDLGDFLAKTLPSFPDFTLYPCPKDSSYMNVILPAKKEDVLVFMALSINLYRFTYGSVPKENYRLSDRVGLFYSNIQNMGKVTRLYRINMDHFQSLPDRLVLDGVKSFVGADSVCYKLVSSFINLETIDEDGGKKDFGCMPVVGEITRVLLNLALMEFDRRLCQKYPGIAFERFIGLVFIACTNDLRIDESQVRDMIEDLGLICDIDYTEPGDEPLECCKRMVALDHDGKVLLHS